MVRLPGDPSLIRGPCPGTGQYLYVENNSGAVDPGNGRQDLEGLGLFSQVGIVDEDTNPITWSFSIGLSGRGTIPGRDADTWGVGYFYNDLHDHWCTAKRQLLTEKQSLARPKRGVLKYQVTIKDYCNKKRYCNPIAASYQKERVSSSLLHI